jgi:prolyl 4-hydroxylase
MTDTPATHLDDAAERDYRKARACLEAQDLDGCAQWLERAAEREHPAALTELAILHLHGFGREANPPRAVELLQRADRVGGTPETPYLLALIAMGGIALPRDPARIDAWVADSARRGYPAALRAAAMHFGQREGIEFQRAAVTCLRRATDARDPISAALLADRLQAGVGTQRDPASADDLARDLRAIDIPVELPSANSVQMPAEHPDHDDAIEPRWESLQLFALPANARIERLCAAPEILVADEFLSDEECRFIMYSGARFLDRSLVVDPETGKPLELDLRTSHDMTFVPSSSDVTLHVLQQRMAGLAGLDLAQCEPLALLRYGIGDEYRPHRDYFAPSVTRIESGGGQRQATVCCYLNNVADGGGTVFPDVDVSVQPQRGRAVMFRSLHPDGRPDPHSLHAGLPVLAGEKWLASCWIRSHAARPF